MHSFKLNTAGARAVSGRRSAAAVAVRSAAAKRALHTPLESYHVVTGARCRVLSNSRGILEAAGNFFRQESAPPSAPSLLMRFWADPGGRKAETWPQPYFRGMGHLAYAGFDSESSVLLDLRRRIVLGRFSRALAADRGYWQRVIFPAIVGLASDALGVTVIHSACVERDGQGLLLAGESGAGKSTLALAMARCGFKFLSDDWTYLSNAECQLTAWGVVTPLKLLPESAQFFPELRRLNPGVSLNGEVAFEVEPEEVFGVRRSLRCEPRWVVFLERWAKRGHALVRMAPREAAERLGSQQGRLPPELSSLRKRQTVTIRSLVERECWLLRYGETPQAVAQSLSAFCAPCRPLAWGGIAAEGLLFSRHGADPTKRLTRTPLAAEIEAAGCAIRLETNSPAILRLVGNSLGRRDRTRPARQKFVWRLVSDGSGEFLPSRRRFSGAAADGLQFVNLGQTGFLAMDAAARCVVGFLAEEVLSDGKRFHRSVLAQLIRFTELAWRWHSQPPLHTGQGGYGFTESIT